MYDEGKIGFISNLESLGLIMGIFLLTFIKYAIEYAFNSKKDLKFLVAKGY